LQYIASVVLRKQYILKARLSDLKDLHVVRLGAPYGVMHALGCDIKLEKVRLLSSCLGNKAKKLLKFPLPSTVHLDL